MNKGVVGILVVAGAFAALYVVWLLRKPPINSSESVGVVLSVRDGACVQTVGGNEVTKVGVKEGQPVEYSANPRSPFSVEFESGNLFNTGSPFPAPAGAWKLQFSSADGSPVTTTSVKLNFWEWLNVFGSDFPYRTVTIDNKACTIRPGGGVHIER